jgi:hypothetical protein
VSIYEPRPSNDYPGQWVVWNIDVNREAIGTGVFATREEARDTIDRLVAWHAKQERAMYERGVTDGTALAAKLNPAGHALNPEHYSKRATLKSSTYECGIRDALRTVGISGSENGQHDE